MSSNYEQRVLPGFTSDRPTTGTTLRALAEADAHLAQDTENGRSTDEGNTDGNDADWEDTDDEDVDLPIE